MLKYCFKSPKTIVVGFIAALFVIGQVAFAAPPPGKGKPTGGGDGGGSTEPPAEFGTCNSGEIGFSGRTGRFPDSGEAADYMVFDLNTPSQGVWGTSNYLHNVTLHAFRPDNDLSDARNIVFGGQPSNTFGKGGVTISYDKFRMPINSKAFLNIQDGTNTSGVNVPIDLGADTGWKPEIWQLCGLPGYDDKYKGWQAAGLYIGDVGANAVSALGGGVNVMGGEYACAQGWGFHHHSAVGVSHKQLKEMLNNWGVNTVRLPMNEHCWVSGLSDDGTQVLDAGPVYDQASAKGKWFQYIRTNNQKSGKRADFARELAVSPENCSAQPSSANCTERDGKNYTVCEGSNCSTQGYGYRESFKHLVEILTFGENNINVVLDLHWTESGGTALDLTDLPGPLSKVFWRSVASEFSGNAKVMFNLFNEPRGIPGDADLWVRWRDGGDGFIGMQDLVDVVRGCESLTDGEYSSDASKCGATEDDYRAKNPVVIGGLDYGGDLRGWLTHVPYDPLGEIWADSHSYPTGDYKCWADSGSEDEGYACWDRTLLPIINEGFGAMLGEAGNSISRGGCGSEKLRYVYNWATKPGRTKIPVLQWAFLPGGASDTNNTPSSNSCRIPSVITRWPGKIGVASPGEEFLVKGELDKDTSDPTPTILDDDGTWAGCLNWAYLNTSFSDWTSLDTDPETDGKRGDCGAYFGN